MTKETPDGDLREDEKVEITHAKKQRNTVGEQKSSLFRLPLHTVSLLLDKAPSSFFPQNTDRMLVKGESLQPFKGYRKVTCIEQMPWRRVTRWFGAVMRLQCLSVAGPSAIMSRRILGGARGVMVTVLGNGHGDTSSNPGRD